MSSHGETDPTTFHHAQTAYALDRSGYTASGRLVFQHYLWKDVTGALIHPHILEDLGVSLAGEALESGRHVELRVADIGTGTGVWALDVARLPSAHGSNKKFSVHGFDISDEQFPPGHVLPENVQLSVSDALSVPPESLHGTFDIVHVAHFAGVRALGEDPAPVIDHALALLKPGGWIQWDEWARDEHGGVELMRLAPSPRCDWALDVSSKIFPKWLLDIAGHLSKHGTDHALVLDCR
ncbi:hypothetical protein B0T25DRAFT_247331 [Lasiosphaeria hispida]|uniref:S-adenosyl-L-methionine-dependent methyltransferase n=1 Tax=Lasiosphaeria hispida TaxID=260671 RepID=A0AAJ0MCW6_9PEZI|nr:hypothetical protein B0T25DRAFT_247331 [Lasiosphaeria hispida]